MEKELLGDRGGEWSKVKNQGGWLSGGGRMERLRKKKEWTEGTNQTVKKKDQQKGDVGLSRGTAGIVNVGIRLPGGDRDCDVGGEKKGVCSPRKAMEENLPKKTNARAVGEKVRFGWVAKKTKNIKKRKGDQGGTGERKGGRGKTKERGKGKGRP